MKSTIVVLLATAASAFATIATAAPFNYNGSFLETFVYPGGSFQHCIELTDTELYQSQGYTYSGTWVDTDYPNTGGTWAVYNGLIHIAGEVDGTDSLTLDGRVGSTDKLRPDTTFDYFSASGIYYATGSVTVVGDDSCAAPSVRKPAGSRSFLN